MKVNWDNLNSLEVLHLSDRLPMGKYKGEKVTEIFRDDPDYICFIYEKDIIKPGDGLLELIKLHNKKENTDDIDEGKSFWSGIFGED